MNCISCKKPNEKNLIVITKFWIVTLSHNQAYLGRGYITSKRHCNNLSELKPDEWSELHDLIKKLEYTLEKAFNATMFNWTCLMNVAYQESPPNPHVHWHFRPRYDHTVEIAGKQFNDPEFGHHYSRKREQSITPTVREIIIHKIKQHL